ncbi:MAG: hypothetical protein WD793_09730 [Steroidobacteraceae bacterium]
MVDLARLDSARIQESIRSAEQPRLLQLREALAAIVPGEEPR